MAKFVVTEIANLFEPTSSVKKIEWRYNEDEVVVLPSITPCTFVQLKPITLRKLGVAGANSIDITALYKICEKSHSEHDQQLFDVSISLQDIMNYCTDSEMACPEKIEWLIEKGFIEKAEPEYVVQVGDRFTIDGAEYQLCFVGKEHKKPLYQLVNQNTGMCRSSKVAKCLDVEGFKIMLGTRVKNWKEIYATRRPIGYPYPDMSTLDVDEGTDALVLYSIRSFIHNLKEKYRGNPIRSC
jgi:hypothetical protein